MCVCSFLQFIGTVLRLGHPVSRIKKRVKLFRLYSRIWGRSQRCQLPDKYSESPNVGFGRVQLIC